MRQIFLGKHSNPSERDKADYWNGLTLTCLRCGKMTPFRLRGKPNVEHRLFEKPGETSAFVRSENFKKAGIVLSP